MIERLQVASVRPLDDSDARVVAEAGGDFAVGHVDGNDVRRAMLEQAIGEAAGGRANIEAAPALDTDSGPLQGVSELFAATAGRTVRNASDRAVSPRGRAPRRGGPLGPTAALLARERAHGRAHGPRRKPRSTSRSSSRSFATRRGAGRVSVDAVMQAPRDPAAQRARTNQGARISPGSKRPSRCLKIWRCRREGSWALGGLGS